MRDNREALLSRRAVARALRFGGLFGCRAASCESAECPE
jgi:hypothetical protein